MSGKGRPDGAEGSSDVGQDKAHVTAWAETLEERWVYTVHSTPLFGAFWSLGACALPPRNPTALQG